jgi:hypothetical protein
VDRVAIRDVHASLHGLGDPLEPRGCVWQLFADLFALGVTLYEAATGRNPHIDGARDPFEVIKRASTQQLPRLGSPLPGDFADLVATLAQPNLVHRCQTAREAHEWIKELCDREGVQ